MSVTGEVSCAIMSSALFRCETLKWQTTSLYNSVPFGPVAFAYRKVKGALAEVWFDRSRCSVVWLDLDTGEEHSARVRADTDADEVICSRWVYCFAAVLVNINTLVDPDDAGLEEDDDNEEGDDDEVDGLVLLPLGDGSGSFRRIGTLSAPKTLFESCERTIITIV
jgi:hypothetical protein